MLVIDIEPDEVSIIREPTTRPNIRYSVITYDGETETLRRIIDGRLASYLAGDYIDVYYRTINEVKTYVEEIGGVPFHSRVGDIEYKREIIKMLSEGNDRVFWSTSALGEGIDTSTIRVVIHVGGIDKLDDFSQQSGRAGRDSTTASESIVL